MPPQRNPHLLTHQLQDELVLYNSRQDVAHTLNATALLVWQCCDGEHEVEDIISKVRTRYNVPPEAVRQDIQNLLNKFQALGLIQPLSQP